MMAAEGAPIGDLDAAREARNEAMERVRAHAHAEWMVVAKRAARWVAEHQATFTSEDVRDAIEHWYPDVTTHQQCAWSEPMNWCKREGIAEPTREVRPYRRRSRHAGTSRVWRSLIYRSPEQ